MTTGIPPPPPPPPLVCALAGAGKAEPLINDVEPDIELQYFHHISGVGADAADNNDVIPTNFLTGCQNDVVEARRRWQLTKSWRQEYKIDSILTSSQPYFQLIKKWYPHAVHKRTRSGHWVYIERPGHASLDKLFSEGVTMTDLEQHYAFITEYLWRVLDPREDGQIISIFDVQKCSLADMAGDTLKMFKKCSALVGAHYPERSHKILVVNAPWFAAAGFAIVSPFLDPRTRQKITMIRGPSVCKALADYCDPSDIPEFLGGTDVTPFGESQAEKDMLQLVLANHQ